MRSKTKIFIKLTSFMLALVTAFYLLPLTAFASEPSENAASVNSEEVSTAEHYGYTNELVTGYTSTVGTSTKAYSYEYDARSNITSVSINGTEKFRYVYDDLNQLIREDNADKNATFVYNYDTSGNILSVKAYPLTAEGVTPSGSYTLTSYGYSSDGWGDKLTSFNGQAITYDSIGNPLTYYNGSSYSFTWQGRQLVGATKGNKTMSFEYNADGIRTAKTVNGVTTKYYLNGSQIVAEVNPNYSIMYIYDADGSPIGMQYRASSYAENVFDYYFFEKNLQGDIVAVYGKDGTKYLEYFYDAWGNFQIGYHNAGNLTHAVLNPFTYRGYYYDSDLNLYYLNSRYYDQNTRRFVNADSYVSTGQGILGNNMYAYCGNNPILYVDYSGEFLVLAAIITGVAAGIALTGITTYNVTKEANYAHNKQEEMFIDCTHNSLIENQNSEVISKYRYGFLSASKNVCEVVAVHNVKVLLGIESSLSQTIYDMQNCGGMWLFGIFGSYPNKVGTLLKYYGINYSKVSLEQLNNPGIYIVSYWAGGGKIHTVAIEYDGNQYNAYNKSGGVSHIHPHAYARDYINIYQVR